MINYKMIIAYDGTNFCGWQRQTQKTRFASIQETIEKAISEIIAEKVEVIASGRTDAGVHAINQVANFKTSKSLNKNFNDILNEKLPSSIVILNINEVDENFHSRYLAKQKTYEYKILNSKINDPFKRDFCLQVVDKLDITLMKEASKLLIGEHDFKSFTNVKTKKSTVKIIYDIKILHHGDFITIQFTGNGFLHNMVRILVGTLIEVGEHKRDIKTISELLEQKERQHAGFMALPKGLYLKEVQY